MAREGIFIGDTLPVAYECRRPDPIDPLHYQNGVPATPISATVKVIDQDETWLPLGGPGTTEADMEITPATGVTRQDTGAIIKYTLPSSFTVVEGNYTMFITATFDNGVILTEDKKFRVLPYR